MRKRTRCFSSVADYRLQVVGGCQTRRNNDNPRQSTGHILAPEAAAAASSSRRLYSEEASSFQVLTHAHLKDTCTILKPAYWHLFPGFGAALSVTSGSQASFIRNLLRLGHHQASLLLRRRQYQKHRGEQKTETVNYATLASKLFYQPQLKDNIVSTSPLQLSRNQSTAIAHVTPAIWGTMYGLAMQQKDINKSNSNDETLTNPRKIRKKKEPSLSPWQKHARRRLLELYGIKSNRMHEDGTWTGVSTARWVELMELMDANPDFWSENVSEQPWLSPTIGQSLYLTALWEMSQSKMDLWDFWKAFEQEHRHNTGNNNFSILNDSSELVQALRHDEQAQLEWAAVRFQVGASSSDSAIDLDSALETLLEWTEPYNQHQQYATARALEWICAHCTKSPDMQKPIVPNGYYSIDDESPVKPDCVEVAVREVLNLLTWKDASYAASQSDASSFFDVQGRLPPTAEPRLLDLYALQQKSETATPESKNKAEKEVTLPIDPEMPASDEYQPLGKHWFDLLQNRSGCAYLSTAVTSGQKYELTPTLSNISVATQLLLFGSELTESKNKAATLYDLADAWNLHADRSNRDESHSSVPKLIVKSWKSSHRPALSDEMVHHEYARLHLEGATSGIELKLDSAHGIASVSHFRRRKQQDDNSTAKMGKSTVFESSLFFDEQQLLKLNQKAFEASMSGAVNLKFFPLLCLSLLGAGEIGLSRSHSHKSLSNPQMLLNWLLVNTLATPIGHDRQQFMQLTSSSDLDLEELAQKKALRLSLDVMVTAIERIGEVMARNQESKGESLVPVLTWLLQETPQVFFASAATPLSPATRNEERDNEKTFSGQLGDAEELLSSLIVLQESKVEDTILQLPPEVRLQVLEGIRVSRQSTLDDSSGSPWPVLQGQNLSLLIALTQFQLDQNSIFNWSALLRHFESVWGEERQKPSFPSWKELAALIRLYWRSRIAKKR